VNILYLEHYAGSPEMGMEFRPYYLSREWVKMGHKVTIIAGDYSHLRKKNPDVSKDMEKQTIDGIDYYWLKTGTYEGNGVKRALTMVRFCNKLNKWKGWINSHLNPDVVISSSTYPIDSIPAHRIGIGGGISSRHIHEVHDMWPSTLTEIGGMSKHNPFVMLMQFGENYAYKHADAVVSLPKYSKDYMMQHGLPVDHFFYIPNGIVIEEWDNPEQLPDEHWKILEKLRADNKFVIGYFGGHALSNCLMTLIQSAEKMQSDNRVHFVLVGDGVEKKELVRYVKEHKLTNITFLSPVNKKAIPTLTESFDCTYIGAKDSPLYRFGACMNKMFDGMMAGKPIIFAINAPTTPVEECNCGIMIKPEEPQEIVNAINRIMAMPKTERAEMGMRGKLEVLDKYTYEKLAKSFADVMEMK
jgi:glycosyltransferase involved in cell wall biosynthesis